MFFPVTSIIVCLMVIYGADGQTVNTTHGQVTGLRVSVLGKSLDVFYGIPFAKPPTGDLRFKHPRPVDPWKPEILDARAMKPSCQQQIPFSFFMPLRATPPTLSEDCLYMNIWSPVDRSPGTRLATMVWIYGGSFTVGSINVPLYDGKYLAAENDVIIVSVNYRVGAHGFLYLSPDTFPGNQGLMDQLEALKWIYNNIENFGGDRSAITIFGESAGGASVGHHLLSPLSRDFFNRAILMSGAPNCIWASETTTAARNTAKNLALLADCPSSSDADIFDCIRQLPPGSILDAQNNITATSAVAFGPVVDGYFLPDNPKVLLEKGDMKSTDILLGVNRDEGSTFLAGALPSVFPLTDNISVTRSQFMSAVNMYSVVMKGFSSMATALVAQYEGSELASSRESYADLADDIFSDGSFKCGVLHLANTFSMRNNVYLYSFEHLIGSLPIPKWMGVPHSFGLEVVFGHPLGDVLKATQEEQSLSRAMMSYWTNFAKNGSPNTSPQSYQVWPLYNKTDERYLVLDVSQNLMVEQGFRKQECILWNVLMPMIVEDPGDSSSTTALPPIVYPCVNSGIRMATVSMATILISALTVFMENFRRCCT